MKGVRSETQWLLVGIAIPVVLGVTILYSTETIKYVSLSLFNITVTNGGIGVTYLLLCIVILKVLRVTKFNK